MNCMMIIPSPQDCIATSVYVGITGSWHRFDGLLNAMDSHCYCCKVAWLQKYHTKFVGFVIVANNAELSV